MRAALMPAVVAAVQITSPSHHDASQIRETFYSLAAAKANNGGKIDEDTEASVNRILGLVEDNLMEALWTDRDAAQQGYNASVAALNKCNADLTGVKLDRYQQHKDNTARDWDTFNECLEGENKICHEKTEVCNDLDQYACDMNVCDDRALSNDECVTCKEETPTQSSLYNALQCIIDFDEQYFDTWKGKYQNCKEHKREHREKIEECDQLQEDLERQKCREQQYIHDSCNEFDGCWSTASQNYDQLVATTRDLENIFQKQWTALECLMCYGKQILAETTNLTVCETAAPPQFACTEGADTDRINGPTTSLAICYYAPESKYDCEGEYDTCVPGTSTFYQKYGEFAGTCAEVDDCIHTCTEYAEQD